MYEGNPAEIDFGSRLIARGSSKRESLYQSCSLTTPAIRMFLHITKDCNFFIFGDRPRHVFKPLLLYFDLGNADTPSAGYMQQPYCASLDSWFLQVRDNPI